MDIIRVLRVLEYVGPRDEVEELIRRSIHGDKVLGGDNSITIRAATIGTYPEILDRLPEAKDEVIPREYTGDWCSLCKTPQFNSPAGVTCDNGHGGADPLIIQL